MNTTQLLELKEKIAKTKDKVNELIGSRKSLNEQLQKEYECSSLEQAERKVLGYEKDLNELSKTIQEMEEDLKERYPTLFN